MSHLGRLDLEEKILTLLPKGEKKKASGLASPVVSVHLLDILPHPDAAHEETPVVLQMWLEALAQEAAIQRSFWACSALLPFPCLLSRGRTPPNTAVALTTHLPKGRPGMTLSHNHVRIIRKQSSILAWKSFQKGSAIPAHSSRDC